MKKVLCALLMLAMMACFTMAMAEECKYAGEGSPCDVGWWIDTEKRMHARACFYHVEDKEDMDSHVLITDWEACTLDEGGECTTCGWDYVRESTGGDIPEEEMDVYQMENYLRLCEELGYAPADVTASGSILTISLTDEFFDGMDELGFPYGETAMAKTKCTLTLPDGETYPATGKAIEPEVELTFSEYGPGGWMNAAGLLVIDEVTYENNVNPGTATVTAVIWLEGDGSYTLTKNFTITGDGSGTGGGEGGEEDDGTLYCKYGSASSPCDIRWSTNKAAKQHYAYCVVHVEDKEDMYSYVQVTDWTDCTFTADEYVCDTCGADYAPEEEEEEPDTSDDEMIMVELYYMLLEKNGRAPLDISVDGNYATIAFGEQFIMCMLEQGITVTESMQAKTVYTLTLREGNEFPYTGEAIEPEAGVDVSPYGPGAWLEKWHLLTIGDVFYERNVEPGTATVYVEITVEGEDAFALSDFFTITDEGGSGEGGENDDGTLYCKYGSASSPCDIRWNTAGTTGKHYAYCVNHVEDKEDMYSYVQVTDWEDCTFTKNEYICDVCGTDYTPEEEPEERDYEAEMVVLYNYLTEKNGRAPMYVEHSANWMSIELTGEFIAHMDERGIPVTESLMLATEYDFTLADGTTYPYTGEEICPEVIMTGSEYGPGAWLEKYHLLYIRKTTYTNNVEPGTATAETLVRLEGDGNFAFTLDFTIVGEAAPERLPGDADDNEGVGVNDAIAILRAFAGEDVSINTENADVTGDGKVNLEDALRLLQYIAGWNVTLQ